MVKPGLPQQLRWRRICPQCGRPGLDPEVRKIPWKTERLPTPVFLPGEFHELRSLAGYRPWGSKELDMTEQLTFSLFLLFSCIDKLEQKGLKKKKKKERNSVCYQMEGLCPFLENKDEQKKMGLQENRK